MPNSVFDEIGVNVHIEILDEAHDCSEFDCGHADTNNFLKDDALKQQKEHLNVTYVVKDSYAKVIGFISLAMGTIKVNPDHQVTHYAPNQYPALKIGRLGRTKEWKKRGVGELLIKIAVEKTKEFQKEIGCRVISLDAYPKRVPYYEENYEFVKAMQYPSGRETFPMYLQII